jgi:predicted nucleic acid-binding protein
MWAYFDSSAVAKLYVQENGRAAVLRCAYMRL